MSLYDYPLIDPNTDPYGFLRLTKNPDGSFSRLPPTIPNWPPCPQSDPDNPTPVVSKDTPINPNTNTWARIYLPAQFISPAPTAKLPLIIYFHGGALIFCSAATAIYHTLCCDIAREIPAVVASIEYRLAPDHRVPAAYDDGVEALHWVKSVADEWVADHADLSNCFLMGSSGGGNVAYQVGLRVIPNVVDLLPVKIRGMILHQPFFGGVERTPSEIRLMNDKVMPVRMTDIAWDLVLPAGADRDHEYCNPMARIELGVMERMRDEGWRVVVTGFGGDPLIDRQKELARKLREMGIEVAEDFKEGGCHGLEHLGGSIAESFYVIVKDFVLSSSP